MEMERDMKKIISQFVNKILGNPMVKKPMQGLATLVVSSFLLAFSAQAMDRVEAVQDAKGWKLQVNGSDYYIKGVVWGYSPKGENYNYNLYARSDEFIKQVLDQEFGLMKAAGVNTIRMFGIMPPRWVTYVYETYGIRTVINHLFGRYGFNVNGQWIPNTNYADPATRQAIKNDILNLVETYKNTKGVLMFALGNENNYGLDWASFEIENLPVGERHREKAKSLYSLFNETIKEAKAIDKSHPYTIVNGDIQYLDLIRALCPDLDILGSNVYRGESFTGLWADVKKSYDLPIVFMEFGSDAFNAKLNREDQQAQAELLRAMWLEMYDKSYGNGAEGNSIGGFVFEWRDEWWKYKQTENLDVQDNTASWANGGYKFDFVEGKNNMNEEWYGISRIGNIDSNGVYITEPRMAYDVLSKIWSIDPYRVSKSSYTQTIQNIDMEFLALRSEVRSLQSGGQQNAAFAMTGGSISGEMVLTGDKANIDKDGLNGIGFSTGEMVNLDFAFQPFNELKGQFTINVLGNVPQRNITVAAYGDRALPVVITNNQSITGNTTLNGNERVEIYDYEVNYENLDYSLSAFYHVPRYHWGYKGDFFGLLHEATDLEGMDIWNAKAPYGVEYTGKRQTPGLTVLFGPEVYWGANPKAMVKYDFGGSDYTLLHAQDIGRLGASSSATVATEKRLSQTTLYMKKELLGTTVELGGMTSSREKMGDTYDYLDGTNIKQDEIRIEDTLAFKAKLSRNVGDASNAYLGMTMAGLVADGGNPLVELGTKLPYSSLGNKQEVEGGVLFNYGTFTVFPRFLVRKNLLDANPTVASSVTGTNLNPGISPRNREDDPFAVLGNREANSAEIVFTYDPTPATSFYQWDNDKREDADLAFNVGLNYTQYPTVTDSHLFYYQQGQVNAAFGSGLAAEDVWLASSHMVMNPNTDLRIVANVEAGFDQSTGKPGGATRQFYSADAKAMINRKHIHAFYFKKDAWGPYDFHRQFDITYPMQVMYDYSLLLDSLGDEQLSSKWGIRGLYRTLDANAPDEFQNGANSSMFEITTYFKANF